MKKILFTFCFALISGMTADAQTIAPDFTAPDCNSVSHNLYTELNAGKIVVLVWVEPCVGCLSDSKQGFDAARSFSSSNPGRVLYWLSDDVGNTSCDTLSAWANSNGISPISVTIFGNSGNVIDEAGFGGSGMPHVVVIGDSTHYIYYNQVSGTGDGAAIADGIRRALAGAAAVPEINSLINPALKLYPNPSGNNINVSFVLPEGAVAGQLNLYDITGRLLQSSGIQSHSGKMLFDNSGLAPGNYYYSVVVDGIKTATEKLVLIR